MALRLPRPPDKFSTPFKEWQDRMISALERWAAGVHERGQDMEAGDKAALILTSPNGTRYRVTVNDAGALTVTAA